MKRSGWLLFGAALCLLAVVCLRMGLAYRENDRNIYRNPDLPNRFPENGEEDFFDTDLPLDNAHFQDWYSTFDRAYVNPIGTPQIDESTKPVMQTTSVPLPCDMHYYLLESGKLRLAYTLPAGTEVGGFIENFSNMLSAGVGLATMPTRSAGWRFGLHFYPLENPETIPFDLYYMRLDEVRQLVHAVVEREPSWFRAQLGDLDDEDLELAVLFYADMGLWRHGIYASKDLYHPYFDGWNIALLSAAGVLAAAYALLRRRARKPTQ